MVSDPLASVRVVGGHRSMTKTSSTEVLFAASLLALVLALVAAASASYQRAVTVARASTPGAGKPDP